MRCSALVSILLGTSVVAGCAPEGPTAFVSHNIPPDSSCLVQPQGDVFLASGVYDIAKGPNDLCARAYVVNLLVNSSLRSNQDKDLGRAEPNVLQIHSAEVRLMDLEKATITFDQTDPALPNPFLVTTNNSIFPSDGDMVSVGIASVEAIPVDYADQLQMFVGSQILAEIQIFGTTTGDVDIDLKPFVYPIELCDECLTTCEGALMLSHLTRDDLVGDHCDDNAGADGRYCITPDSDCL